MISAPTKMEQSRISTCIGSRSHSQSTSWLPTGIISRSSSEHGICATNLNGYCYILAPKFHDNTHFLLSGSSPYPQENFKTAITCSDMNCETTWLAVKCRILNGRHLFFTRPNSDKESCNKIVWSSLPRSNEYLVTHCLQIDWLITILTWILHGRHHKAVHPSWPGIALTEHCELSWAALKGWTRVPVISSAVWEALATHKWP